MCSGVQYVWFWGLFLMSQVILVTIWLHFFDVCIPLRLVDILGVNRQLFLCSLLGAVCES